jgi:hypothetical protein
MRVVELPNGIRPRDSGERLHDLVADPHPGPGEEFRHVRDLLVIARRVVMREDGITAVHPSSHGLD